jgi:3-oxoacyl-[acyl-carrier protein] reductase
MRLKDKVAIITGAGQGLGKEFAIRFAEEGAKVVIAEINFEKAQEVAKEIEQNGGDVLALKTDITKKAETEAMAQKTIERFGRIDVLVNNAAIYYGIEITPFTDLSEEDWDTMMEVNVKGMWLCCRAVFSQMKEQGKGKIVNMASAVFNVGIPGVLHYVTSKGAVVGLTRALAKEIGQFGINVNCINPGYVWTEASQKFGESFPPGFIEAVDNMQVVKRREQPSDLTGAVIYFASDEADFVTGQSFVVDGGMVVH